MKPLDRIDMRTISACFLLFITTILFVALYIRPIQEEMNAVAQGITLRQRLMQRIHWPGGSA